ncbi:MAG: hypothetical protein WDN48_10755 [Pseudolabrys sp.]
MFEHDLIRKPVPTFRDHALGRAHLRNELLRLALQGRGLPIEIGDCLENLLRNSPACGWRNR